ncbi:hypothetical protein IPM62_04665 [Candidatus Woesebacteria bacterium]|nr:MAG: hypothetical protein IPM62_04665 [Candidatus Woesebacteria bacterium]
MKKINFKLIGNIFISKYVYILLGLLLFRLVLAFIYWHGDLNNHVDWGIRFYQYGPQQFYAPDSNVWNFTWPNQPPGTIYIFALIRKIYEMVFNLLWIININISLFPSIIVSYSETNLYPALLKLPSILADFGIAYFISKIILLIGKNEKIAKLSSLIFLLNPVIWYNSAVWGQTDAIVNFLAIASFYFLMRKKLTTSALLYAICLYIKLSLAIYIPIYVIVALHGKYKIKHYLITALICFVAIFMLTYPFAKLDSFTWLYSIYVDKVLSHQLHVITANAFNLWAFLTGIHERPNSDIFFIYSYEMWGNALFLLSYIVVSISLVKDTSHKSLVMALLVVSFSGFMLLTNMHERYIYPVFVPLTIIAGINRKYIKTLVIMSIINLFNLYNFWWYPKIDVIVEIMSGNDRLAPRLLSLFSLSVYFLIMWWYLQDNKPYFDKLKTSFLRQLGTRKV